MEEDEGTAEDALSKRGVKIFGMEKWQEHVDEVTKSWDEALIT